MWVDIPGFEGKYKISKSGKIKSLPRLAKIRQSYRLTPTKILKTANWGEYKTVRLYDAGIVRGYAVHRLLAITFIPNPLKKPCINHKNGKKWDNRLKNLEWCTHKENIQHAHDMGFWKYTGSNTGSKSPTTSLTEEIVMKIKRDLKTMRNFEIALKYNIKARIVSEIKTGRSWKHVIL